MAQINNYVAILIECDNIRSLGGSCERDINNIYERLLLNGLDKSNIYILTNNKQYFINKGIKINLLDCTKSNLIDALSKVLSTNSLYIHISGHGYQGLDIKQIELDGKCEQIVLSSGILTDYDFYELLTKYVNYDKKIRMTIDTCHSGTFSNFTYEICSGQKQIATKKTPYFLNAFSISACADNQLDACDIGNIGFGGSLTVHLLENNNFEDFLFGSPFEVKQKLQNILRLLGQEPMLLCDN